MATPTTTINVTTQKADNVLELQALIHGLTVLLPQVDPFLISRKTYARGDLLARIQARLDAAIAAKNSRIALHNAVEAERIAAANFKDLKIGLRAYLVSVYSPNAPELQQFGYVQNRRPKRSVQAKASALLKATATRKARGTKGAKQKASTHGATATAATTAPATASAATTAAAPATVATTAPAAAASPPHATVAPGATNTSGS